MTREFGKLKMSDSARIEELEARIAVLEAAVRTGTAKAHPVAEANYPFLDKLSDEDRYAAQALVQENATLREQVASLTNTLEQKNYQIEHLKNAVASLLPPQESE